MHELTLTWFGITISILRRWVEPPIKDDLPDAPRVAKEVPLVRLIRQPIYDTETIDRAGDDAGSVTFGINPNYQVTTYYPQTSFSTYVPYQTYIEASNPSQTVAGSTTYITGYYQGGI